MAFKILRIIFIVYAYLIHLRILRPKKCSEQEIPKCSIAPIICIRLVNYFGMMPAMQFWSANDIIQPPQLNIDIAMLKKTFDCVNDKVKCGNLLSELLPKIKPRIRGD